jgi:hypothetical protein
MSYQIKNGSTAYPLVFMMVDSTDHISAKTGLSPTVTLSKAGAAFASPSGAVTEIANGWYKVAGNATDTGTNGPLILHATGTGADPTDTIFEVVAFDPQDAVRQGLTALPNVASGSAGAVLTSGTGTAQLKTTSGIVDLPAITSGWLTAAGIAAAALNGKGDWNIGKTGFSLTQAFPTNFSSLSISAGGLVDLLQTAADKAWGTTSRVLTAGTNIALAKGTGITGFNDLDAAGVAGGVWNAATASYGSAGSYGLLIETNLDAQVSAVGGGTAASIADAVWDELLSGHTITGSAGAGLSAAGSAGDPWSTPLPGSYGSGSAGYIIGNTLDAAISSRLASGSYSSPPSVSAIADQVWDEVLSGHLTGGTTGAALNGAGAAGDPWGTALPGAYSAGSAGYIMGNNLNAKVGDVKTKTDFLPSATAGAAGGLFIAGSNAATTVNITGTIDTVTTLTTKTGFSLSTAGIQAIWDALTSALTTAGSIGKRIADFLTGDAYVRLGAPAGASTAADIAAAKVDTAAIKAKTDSLTFTGAGVVDSNLVAVKNSTTHATALDRALAGNVIGTIGTGSTTTSLVSSALTPAGSVSTQFKGRIITFADTTTTAALRGQSTDITASTASATPTFTVTALTTAPVSGDTFVIT